MRRSLSARFVALIFVLLMSAPAFAAPRDDSPIGGFERAISRIVKIIRTLVPMDFVDAGPPKP
jgi:hypothetical protein